MPSTRLEAHLLLDIDPLHPDHTRDDSDRHERVVVHEFGRGEGREGIDEELSSLLEVSNREEVKTLVDLEPITSIPVSSFVDEPDINAERKGSGSERKESEGRRERADFEAFGRLVVMSSMSLKKNPTRTMVRTISIRAPSPGVFSKASSKAASDRV